MQGPRALRYTFAMSQTQALEVAGTRLVSAALVAAYVWLAPLPLVLAAGIVLGQGHFLLAYWYQADGGKLGSRKVLYLLAALAAVAYVGSVVPFPVFGFLTGAGFLIHFAIDEARIVGGKHSLYTTLETLPFFIVFVGVLANGHLHQDWFAPVLALAALAVLTYAGLCLAKKRFPNATSYVFYGWTLLTLFAYVGTHGDPALAARVAWGIIIVHYFVWYGIYWFKLSAKPAERTLYVLRSVLLNALLIFVAAVWYQGVTPVFALLFTPLAFNVWTLMHGFSTLRPEEFVRSARLSA